MNSVQLVGRLTRDPEVNYTGGGNSIARLNVAVDRRKQTENGDSADFISCVAFGKTAEFIEKYFHKGNRIGLNGRIQTGSYINKDGAKVYTTDVVVDNVEFVESKGSSNNAETTPAKGNDFMNIPDEMAEELPFN